MANATDHDALREGLARWFLAEAMDPQGRSPEGDADAVLALPELAPLLAKAESAERVAADYERGLKHRNDLMDRVVMLKTEAAAATARADRLAAEIAALRAERDKAVSHLPEGLRDTSLAGAVQALAFSARTENDSKWRWGHALTIGLAFADKAAGEEWEHGGIASVDACLAMAAILRCECGGDEWSDMAKAGIARLAEQTALRTAPPAGTDAPVLEDQTR